MTAGDTTIVVFALMLVLAGILIGYEWGKSVGIRLGRILGAVDRDRELHAPKSPFKHPDTFKKG